MMLDGEVGAAVRADVAMAVMLGFSLPQIIFGRLWELLRRWRDRRRDLRLHGRDRAAYLKVPLT
jgi:hypothetical protein